MPELIHTCYRVADLDRSIAFYEKLGMEEIGRIPIRDEAINVFMGLPGDGPRRPNPFFLRYCPSYRGYRRRPRRSGPAHRGERGG